MSKKILITGTSSGIGRYLKDHLICDSFNRSSSHNVNQNNTYELTGLFLGLLRLHESKGSRVTKVAFNQAHRYVFPNDEKNQIPPQHKSIEEVKINSMGE